ncbi:MAG: immunity protein Imm33 domain-containing protein [Agromyces sp.]
MTLQLNEFSRQIGPVVVAVTAADSLVTQAAALLDLFEAHADELADGFSVQAGWAPFLLLDRGEGRLDVAAPDFATKNYDQMGWVTDLTLALWVLNGQVVLAREVGGAEASPVRFTDTVLCYRGIEGADRLIMSRTSRKDAPDDSGWYIDVFPQPTAERGASEFVRWPAYQTLGVNKHISRALLLPEGYGAIVSAEHIDAVTDLSTSSVAVRGPL